MQKNLMSVESLQSASSNAEAAASEMVTSPTTTPSRWWRGSVKGVKDLQYFG